MCKKITIFLFPFLALQSLQVLFHMICPPHCQFSYFLHFWTLDILPFDNFNQIVFEFQGSCIFWKLKFFHEWNYFKESKTHLNPLLVPIKSLVWSLNSWMKTLCSVIIFPLQSSSLELGNILRFLHFYWELTIPFS